MCADIAITAKPNPNLSKGGDVALADVSVGQDHRKDFLGQNNTATGSKLSPGTQHVLEVLNGLQDKKTENDSMRELLKLERGKDTREITLKSLVEIAGSREANSQARHDALTSLAYEDEKRAIGASIRAVQVDPSMRQTATKIIEHARDHNVEKSTREYASGALDRLNNKQGAASTGGEFLSGLERDGKDSAAAIKSSYQANVAPTVDPVLGKVKDVVGFKLEANKGLDTVNAVGLKRAGINPETFAFEPAPITEKK